MRTFNLSLALAVLLLPGCSGDTMPSYTVLQGLRVVGLLIDKPEIGFNGAVFSENSVNLTPIISDLYGGGRSLTYRVYHCIDPGVGLGATPSCAGNPTRTDVSTGTTFDVTTGLGTFSAPNATGDIGTINIPLVSAPLNALYAAYYAGFSDVQKFNGYSILIFFELFPTGDESKKITTFKRLVFSGPAKVVKNQNPTGGSLQFRQNGSVITALPTSESPIDAFVAPGEKEAYQEMASDGSLSGLTETIETVWFLTGPQDVGCSNKKTCTTDGLFARTRTVPGELNLFYPPQVPVPSTRGRVLLGIAKDNRGGATTTRLCDGAGLCP
ncbi:hypothetical protein EB061_04405 [bacterium]|nr:hypothetical protein [bacterium]